MEWPSTFEAHAFRSNELADGWGLHFLIFTFTSHAHMLSIAWQNEDRVWLGFHRFAFDPSLLAIVVIIPLMLNTVSVAPC